MIRLPRTSASPPRLRLSRLCGRVRNVCFARVSQDAGNVGSLSKGVLRATAFLAMVIETLSDLIRINSGILEQVLYRQREPEVGQCTRGHSEGFRADGWVNACACLAPSSLHAQPTAHSIGDHSDT